MLIITIFKFEFYRWKCSSNITNPCIVIGKPLTGLESVLSEEEMKRPILRIPAGYLPPGKLGVPKSIYKNFIAIYEPFYFLYFMACKNLIL